MFHNIKSFILFYNTCVLFLNNILIFITILCFQVRYVSISWTYRPPRWVRISASRVIVLTIVLSAVIVDFTRFFERQPAPLAGQCYNATLYEWSYSEFGYRVTYGRVYPWAVGSLCFLLPFSLTLLFATFHMIRTKFFSKCCCSNEDMIRVKIKSEYDSEAHSVQTGFNEPQLDSTLTAVVMLYLLLELPLAVTTMYSEIDREVPDNTKAPAISHLTLTLIATALSQLRSSINFLVLVTLNPDFRKTFRRTCCCCTLANSEEDEFYEPLDCGILCPCPDPVESSSEDETPNEIRVRRSWIPNSKVRDAGDELWI